MARCPARRQPKKFNKANVQIPGQPVKGAQNNKGMEEPGPAGEKSKTVLNHENESEVMSWPTKERKIMVNDSKTKLETKAYTKIDDEKFKTLPEQRGWVRNRVNERGLERFRKQFAIGDQVRVRNHKTRRWSEAKKQKSSQS